VRWTLGARADLLRDAFTPEGGDNLEATHFAFSPKLGVNVRYAESGNAWVSASRTFKAPTLDQLFDQRPIPIPFPPFSLTTSNPELEPQRGTSAEAGLYHDVAISSARLGLTVTVYEIAMRDELDFDLQTFKYVNIARSRHRGFETGLTVSHGITSLHASLTLQDVVSRAGANTGKRLKAIPGHLLSAGATITPRGIGTISASITRTADVWLDDANTRRFPSWTRIDAQFSRPFGSVALVLGARNLFDKRYNTTGFLDASGSGQAYYYPAAGRVLTLGIRRGR
jgi:outer membrane receptor protein involved in Fe transport